MLPGRTPKSLSLWQDFGRCFYIIGVELEIKLPDLALRTLRVCETPEYLPWRRDIMPIKVLFIFGTRPEAIKLCPVIRVMEARPRDFSVRVCVTAQHREMLDQVLRAFDVTPDRDLDIMRPGQTLYQSTSRIIGALESVLAEEKPDIILVQGDTTTTLCGALSAFYAKRARIRRCARSR